MVSSKPSISYAQTFQSILGLTHEWNFTMSWADGETEICSCVSSWLDASSSDYSTLTFPFLYFFWMHPFHEIGWEFLEYPLGVSSLISVWAVIHSSIRPKIPYKMDSGPYGIDFLGAEPVFMIWCKISLHSPHNQSIHLDHFWITYKMIWGTSTGPPCLVATAIHIGFSRNWNRAWVCC